MLTLYWPTTKVSLTLKERHSVVRELSGPYRKAGKKAKSEILDHLVMLAGYTRSYASRVLRARQGESRRERSLRRTPTNTRRRIYDQAVQEHLFKVWLIMDCPAGKRLSPFLPEIVPVLESFGEISLSDEVRRKLLTISAATIDRLMAPERKRMGIKGRCGTKPGSLLKQQIPIKTFSEWDDRQPGFLEVDLVSHGGWDTRGDFAHTLDIVDVATRWTETRAVKNKAQVWVFEALKHTFEKFPFPVRGIDSDNGSEFINDELMRFCVQEEITFTRGRPYRKNDSCYVEQKNWSVVRKASGYMRYDTPEQLNLLNRLYDVLRLYTNYFQPVMCLIRKERSGSRIKKTYDRAQTSYRRIIDHEGISEEAKASLRREYQQLNPAQLKREILNLQETLLRSRPRKDKEQPITEVEHLEYISS